MENREGYFSRYTVIIARALHLLFVLAMLSSALPLQLVTPVWYLRLADAAVSNAPVLLIAIYLFKFTCPSSSDHYKGGEKLRRFSRLLGFWFAFYAILIPLQLLSYGWLITSSSDGLQRQMSESRRTMETLKKRVQLSPSVDTLADTLREISIAPTIGKQVSLGDQRREALQLIDMQFAKFESGLGSQRIKMIVDLIPGVLRTSIGGTIVIFALLAMKRDR